MSIASMVMPQIKQQLQQRIEGRLPKVISPTMHGVLDYGHAAFFLGAALFLRKSNPRAALAAAATGGFVLVQSLLTDYPLGWKPMIPFREHGELDTAMAGASLAIPRLLGFAGTREAKLFEANSLVESAIVGMTDYDSERARADGSVQTATGREAAVVG